MRDDYLRAALAVIDDPNILVNVVSRRVKQLRRGYRPLVESLESYAGNPERLTRPEKRVVSHETSANHAAEDENDFEAMQDSAATDEEAPTSNFDLDGKHTGDERQEYLEKRRRDNYGQDVTESAATKSRIEG